MARLHREPFAGDGNGIVRRISNDGRDREADGANDASSAAPTLPLWQNNEIEAACERRTLWALQQRSQLAQRLNDGGTVQMRVDRGVDLDRPRVLSQTNGGRR